MSLPAPTYIVCPTCGNDHFLLSRRIYTIPLEGGDLQRSWGAGENSSMEIVCSKDQTRMKWDPTTQKYNVITS